jgi:hypothetical protein
MGNYSENMKMLQDKDETQNEVIRPFVKTSERTNAS